MFKGDKGRNSCKEETEFQLSFKNIFSNIYYIKYVIVNILYKIHVI